MDLKYYKHHYCSDIENVENYEYAKKDNFKSWDCHHRLETHNSDGVRRLVDISAAELKALGMYYNRPAEELIFLTEIEHRSLHMNSENNPMRNADTRKKASESHKGKHHSSDTKRKIGEANKGNTATKDMHWYNNGKINIMAYECPPGFVSGMLKRK